METDNYGPQGNHMRRRRNVNFNEGGEQQYSERTTTHLGIQWDESESKNHSDEMDSIESYNRVPLSNREMALKAQDMKTTIPFRVGNCEVSIGQLQAPKSTEGSQKLTVHLEPDLVNVLKKLKKSKLAPSISWIVSESIKQYLLTNGS